MIVPLALVVGGVGALFAVIHLAIHTIYQTKQTRQNMHKVNTNGNTKIMQNMQACKMAIFIVQIVITKVLNTTKCFLNNLELQDYKCNHLCNCNN